MPIDNLRGLENATDAQLANVQTFANGREIDWPDLGESVELDVLFSRVLGITTAAEIGRRGGSSRSTAKTLASARNGAKGGRPRKKVTA